MGDIARASLNKYCEDKLYKLFGVNAELLIDHAWGWEPCTLAEIKAYQPLSSSLGSGQVLQCPDVVYDNYLQNYVRRNGIKPATLYDGIGEISQRIFTEEFTLEFD